MTDAHAPAGSTAPSSSQKTTTKKTAAPSAPEADAAGRDYKQTLFLPQTDFPMRAGLPKKEPELLARWERLGLYHRLREESRGRDPFILHDGPPYANGHLHIGHALNKILKDFIVRTRQVLGYDSAYVPGWDCHGLPIEWKVEEEFRAKGRKKADVPAQEFRAACRAYAEKWVDIQREEFKRLGVLGDWDRPYLTMDYASEAAIVREFLTFAENGLLVRGSKPVMWSPVEQTALAEAEVEYHDHQSSMIWVKFPIVGYDGDPATNVFTKTKTHIVIWTTTPWTIPANRAITYGPDIVYGLYDVIGRPQECWARIGDRYIVADALAPAVFHQARLSGVGAQALDPAMVRRLDTVTADEIAAMTCAHPLRGAEGAHGYYDFDVPLLPGDHVTDEAGTGFVHTAPGHGVEDYDAWRASGRTDIPDTVGPDGAYQAHVGLFAGKKIVKTDGKKAGQDGDANKAVIEALIAADALLARGRLTHSYPHSWRSKAPLIYRNTPQWFIAMDTPFTLKGESTADAQSLRQRALKAIDATAWHPPQAVNRIRTMVESRPDWLISRQRAWGVPLTLFVHAETGQVLVDEVVNQRIVRAIEKSGADAWWSTPKSQFLRGRLPEGHSARDYEKVTDILDVWFDSGSTHAFTLEARDDQRWPADVYLEGTDQHRGWFQSSLLEGCGTRGRAPYDAVVTHGFTLDEDGRKMSKSLGNIVAPQEVTSQYGAEILRLWVASTDYEHDQRMGPNILKAAVDSYRKLRNTLRYLLGALHGFTDAERVETEDMPGLEQFMRHRLAELDAQVRAAYEEYDFKAAYTALFNFAASDLSAFYLDIRKDSLYCDRPSALRRRAARTIMDEAFTRLTVWLAPILSFTMEEAWLDRFPSAQGSVHARVFPPTPQTWRQPALADRWARLRRVRRVVTGALEIERRDKRLGSSLEAAPLVFLADAGDRAALEAEAALAGVAPAAFLAEIAITSQAVIEPATGPHDAFRLEDVADVAVVPQRAEGPRCARSWRVTPDVGQDPRYRDLSARDAEAVAEWDAAHA